MNLPSSEWSEEFEKRRKNRVATSRHKYGSAKDNFGKHFVSALKSAELCKRKYLETGNTEYLLDMGNYIMFEYMYPSVPSAYFNATDSGGSAGISGISIKEIEKFRGNDL